MTQDELIEKFVSGHFKARETCGNARIYHGQLLYRQSCPPCCHLVAMWADDILAINDEYFYNRATRKFQDKFTKFLGYPEVKKKLHGTAIRGYLLQCLTDDEISSVRRKDGYIPYERRAEIAKKLLIKNIGGFIYDKTHYVKTLLQLTDTLDERIKSMPLEKVEMTRQEVLVAAIVDRFTMDEEETGFFRVLRSINDSFKEIVDSAAVAKMIKSAGGGS